MIAWQFKTYEIVSVLIENTSFAPGCFFSNCCSNPVLGRKQKPQKISEWEWQSHTGPQYKNAFLLWISRFGSSQDSNSRVWTLVKSNQWRKNWYSSLLNQALGIIRIGHSNGYNHREKSPNLILLYYYPGTAFTKNVKVYNYLWAERYFWSQIMKITNLRPGYILH